MEFISSTELAKYEYFTLREKHYSKKDIEGLRDKGIRFIVAYTPFQDQIVVHLRSWNEIFHYFADSIAQPECIVSLV